MKKIAMLILLAASIVATSAQAALIKFEIDPEEPMVSQFDFVSPLNGSFVLDTSTQTLSEISLSSSQSKFDTGIVIENPVIGLKPTSFFFSGDLELLFEIPNFDRNMPGLEVDDSILLEKVSAQQDSIFDDGFQAIGLDIGLDSFLGSITATRLEDVAVNAPVSMALLMSLGFLAVRGSKKRH